MRYRNTRLILPISENKRPPYWNFTSVFDFYLCMYTYIYVYCVALRQFFPYRLAAQQVSVFASRRKVERQESNEKFCQSVKTSARWLADWVRSADGQCASRHHVIGHVLNDRALARPGSVTSSSERQDAFGVLMRRRRHGSTGWCPPLAVRLSICLRSLQLPVPTNCLASVTTSFPPSLLVPSIWNQPRDMWNAIIEKGKSNRTWYNSAT